MNGHAEHVAGGSAENLAARADRHVHEAFAAASADEPVRPTAHVRGYGALLDELQRSPAAPGHNGIVIAGVATSSEPCASAARVAAGLEREAGRRGLRAIVANLVPRRDRIALCVTAPGMVNPPNRSARPRLHALELCKTGVASNGSGLENRYWLRPLLDRFDLVLITGPSLDTTTVSSAVAAGCRGLLVTSGRRQHLDGCLSLARRHERATGCRLVGLVVDATPS